MREDDLAVSVAEIDVVLGGDHFEVEAQVFFEFERERDGAVLIPFSAVDGDEVAVQVDIGDAEAEAFFEAESGPIEERGDEAGWALELVDDFDGLVFCKHGGDAFGAVGADDVADSAEISFDDFSVEEQDCIECLILCRCSHVFVSGEIREERFYFFLSHIFWVFLPKMENESFNPVEIGVFGPFGEVFEADMIADDVEEFWLFHGSTP